VDLLAAYAGQKSDLAPWYAGAELNRDGDLRLQYLAGWGIKLQSGRFHLPPDLELPPAAVEHLHGSPERVQSLMYAISAEGGG